MHCLGGGWTGQGRLVVDYFGRVLFELVLENGLLQLLEMQLGMSVYERKRDEITDFQIS